jgi:leader peptidase (prepilin peptidase)/N-methyltransferase
MLRAGSYFWFFQLHLFSGEKILFDLFEAYPYVVLFFFGTLLGSFANVVILRLPRGESVIRPRSRCPKCQTQIKWYDNIPILSWLILRARCRKCGNPISARYPLVEFMMGLAFALAFYFIGWQWYLLEALIFLFGLITVIFIDIDHFLLPDIFTLSGIVIGLIGALINPERSFVEALLGVLMGGGFLWAIAYFYYVIRKEEGMGGGDIKLLAWIGAVLGWKAVPFVIVGSSLIGTAGGLIAAARNKKGMKTVIPFGPYLALGAVLYLFGGEQIAHWYLGLFIPELQ